MNIFCYFINNLIQMCAFEDAIYKLQEYLIPQNLLQTEQWNNSF